jgi:phosphoenolpyruvate-protein kinase (PTS system EI component)
MYTRRKVLKGISISSGIAMGRARVVHPGHLNVAELPIPASMVKTEVAALEKAVPETVAELEE